ncbi:chemotaxis protein CheW [Ammoniphilus sp. CFH 90114]|uniref:chemotaxis protein CheW n=1 Tax=Ammoniphilus sp. CFH 90114 TaxID=2493665 RepID=UPI00100F06B5|nr:chemotaxis protein CheW [Ammoniphilus sp. CFH 90114]RXT05182.1 purine-binding chemotaxis protein CheW [Ammoniphilus sp. CFH 90114]
MEMDQSSLATVDALNDLLKIVIFRINDEDYGIDVTLVNSIERMTNVTRVPNVNDYIIGVMNLRGSVIPTIDLRKRFGLPSEPYNEDTRIIVLSLEEIEVGIVVDSCSDVTDINRSEIEPPPTVVGGIESTYIQGVTKMDRRLIILLDMEKTLKS